jgi:hypothetical protein
MPIADPRTSPGRGRREGVARQILDAGRGDAYVVLDSDAAVRDELLYAPPTNERGRGILS